MPLGKQRLSAGPVKVPQAYGWVENKKLLGLRECGNCCGKLRKGITANGSPGTNNMTYPRDTAAVPELVGEPPAPGLRNKECIRPVLRNRGALWEMFVCYKDATAQLRAILVHVSAG
jgi:hypothetical protein